MFSWEFVDGSISGEKSYFFFWISKIVLFIYVKGRCCVFGFLFWKYFEEGDRFFLVKRVDLKRKNGLWI